MREKRMRTFALMVILFFMLGLPLFTTPLSNNTECFHHSANEERMILSDFAYCIEPPSGVVSWWPGDGNCRDIAGVNPGTPEGGTAFAPGMVDQAFSFDAFGDYVWASGEGIDELQQLTIETWVYLNSLPDRIMRFVTLAPPGLERAVIRYGRLSPGGFGQLHFYMRIGDETTPFTSLGVENVLESGKWHHVAGTYDGTYMHVYLDGVQKDSLHKPGLVPIGEHNGVRMSSPDEHLDGLLDEVTVYNRALDASEIQAIYAAGSSGKCKPQDIVRYPEALDLGVVDIGDQKTGMVTAANEGGSPLTIFETSLLPWSCEDMSITMHSDQINDVATTSMGMGIGIPGSLYQSFVPKATPLIAASIRLRGLFPDDGYTPTMRLRSGSWDGPILATASEFILGPITVGSQVDVLFLFPDGVLLNPGEIYFIEWISPIEGVSSLSWMASDEDPYPEGTVINHRGDPYEDMDFVFATFVPPDVMRFDQVNDKDTDLSMSMGIGIPGSLYQSFVPTATPLIAASIRLRAGGLFPDDGYTTTMRLRSGSWDGPILATASEFIPGPITGEHQVDVLFQFPGGVLLNPGEIHFIEWVSPIEGVSSLGWMYSEEDPYPEGTVINHEGNPYEDWDFVFATFVPILISPGDVFKVGITYTPTFIGVCRGELVIHSDDPGEHVIYVQLHGRSTLAYSGWIEYPVFLDGQISYADEWSDTVPYEVHPRRAWGWPNKQQEDTDISYYARFKNDDEWLYLLYEATWTSASSPPEGAGIQLFFFVGNSDTDSDSGWVGLGGGTSDLYGWSGGAWDHDINEPTGTNDVEGFGYSDGTTYWFEFRKRLNSMDGYDWSFEPGDLIGNRLNPAIHPNMNIALWDDDLLSTYEQNIAVQLSTLTFKAVKLNKQMIEFQKRDNVIHIFVHDDIGSPGQPPAVVRGNKPVIFGFEWTLQGGTIEDLRESYIGNPDHKIWVSVDGSDSFSLKSWYQEPFFAETGSGPKWMWDHDGDGPGDRDGDGIGDWSGPVLFFRYEAFRLTRGIHTFEFTAYIGPGLIYTDTITVIKR